MKDIDFVITWVDGDDPELKAKRQAYLQGTNYESRPDVAGSTRYRSLGEIGYCVASILRFAPFARKIYIVTDNQNPCLDDFISHFFPENDIPIEIVDHRVIFHGYEEYLPTFNSRTIESMIWRLPGLSDRYIYMNDDFLLAGPVNPEMWFNDGKQIIYGYWHNTLTAILAGKMIKLRHREAPVRFRDGMLNAAKIVGGSALWRFVRIQHTPHALDRTIFEKFFDKHPDVLKDNIAHRFRHKDQFNPQELNYLLALKEGKGVLESKWEEILAYYEPKNAEKFNRLMEALENSNGYRFLCINSLDQAPAEEARRLTDWIERRLGVSLRY